jgi:hypothetical protein
MRKRLVPSPESVYTYSRPLRRFITSVIKPIMNNVKMITASSLAAGLLLTAMPVFADENVSVTGDNGDWHLGAFISALPHLTVNADLNENDNDRDDSGTSTATSTHMKQPFTGTVEVGTVSSVNGSSITLLPAINLNGTSSASTNVVTNSSTKFKGVSSTASLTAGENVVIVGTTSTSTPNTIDASIVVLLQNIGHFFHKMFWH